MPALTDLCRIRQLERRESNVVAVQLQRDWWDDPSARTMPEVISSEKDKHADDARPLPRNITSYNATGEIGDPPRKE